MIQVRQDSRGIGCLRLTRSGLTPLGAAVIATAEIMVGVLVAHVVAGGALPDIGWLLAVAVVVFGATLLVLRRRVRRRWMVPALVVVQLALHEVFAATATAGAHAGHHAHHGGSTVDGSLSWQMLLAHVVSGLITAGVWGVRRRLVRTLLRCQVAPRLLVSARRQVLPFSAVMLAWLSVWALGGPRRGPPLLILAA